MTKVFLEKISLNPENEQLILEAFSHKNLKKVKEFDLKERTMMKKTTDKKLIINNLLVLQ